jgi:hypothetical protein
MATVTATVNCCNCQHSKTKFQQATFNFQLSRAKFQLTTDQLTPLFTQTVLAFCWVGRKPCSLLWHCRQRPCRTDRTRRGLLRHLLLIARWPKWKIRGVGGLLFFAKITGRWVDIFLHNRRISVPLQGSFLPLDHFINFPWSALSDLLGKQNFCK